MTETPAPYMGETREPIAVELVINEEAQRIVIDEQAKRISELEQQVALRERVIEKLQVALYRALRWP